MKILADYHHHDLWESLALLCDRFGWEFYRPMGMEWFDEGYWNFERAWHGDAVAKQYLTPWGSDAGNLRYDGSHGRWQTLIRLVEARDTKFDLVLATVAHNHEGLHRFARENGAKFGIQLGNVRFSAADMAEDRWDLADLGLVSAVMPITPPKPHVIYHQEFSLEAFRHAPPPRHEPFRISSFVNCFPENRDSYADFTRMATEHPEWDWRVYGAYGSVPVDQWACGNIGVCADVGEAMRQSDIAWHAKQWSDGYGHVIHNWFAVGRPVFGFARYYADQLAGPLWVDGVTSVDLGSRSPHEVAGIIAALREDPEQHQVMCEAAARRFREIVNFDEEAGRIRALIESVL